MFVVATGVLLVSAVVAGANPFAGVEWGRWDSALYLLIAERGYDFVACPAPYAPGNWCGSAGWFPGYPVLLAPLFSLAFPKLLTAVLVSWIFDFALLLLLWCGFLRDQISNLRYAGLVLAAFAPAGVYMRAVFPMSMTAFFIVAALLLMRNRPLWAGAMVGVASFCYLTAAVIVPVVVVWVYIDTADCPTSRRYLLAGTTGLLGLSGVLAVFLIAQLQTGHWNAYFLIQAHYGHGFHFPLATLWGILSTSFGPAAYASTIGTSAYGLRTQGLEALLAAAVVASALIAIARLFRLRLLLAWDLAVLVSVVLLWLAPLTQANLSYWRGDALLVPAALLIPRMPRAVGVGIAVASAAVFPLLAATFFEGILR